jgi:hypothetical protein
MQISILGSGEMMFPKQTAWRSKKYTDWIKLQPCYWCGKQAEPHHLKGIGSMAGASQKAPDWAIVPLCHECHMKMHGDSSLWPEQWEMICRTIGKAVSEGVLK